MKKRSFSSILLLLLYVVATKAQIKVSDDNTVYWYNLLSAKSGVEGIAITENNDEQATFPLTVTTLTDEDLSQQWKFVQSKASGRYYIVNRKSGKQIIANSVAQGPYNATQLGTDEVNHKGYKAIEIAEGQYAFSGTEADNVERYLALTDLKENKPLMLDKENLASSAFAWVAVETATQGIETLDGEAVIKVKNRRIVVENAKEYKVTNLAGIQFGKKAILEPGIYVVTVNGTSTNVYVK